VKWHNLTLLWVVLPALAMAWLVWRGRRWRRGITFSCWDALEGCRPTLAVRLRWLPAALRWLAVSLLIIASIRPQVLMGEDEVKLKGINIMLVTDLSGSMIAEDLKPNRITAEKKVLTDFVRRIKYDNVGLVVFGAKSFTQSPLTMDYEILANAIEELDLNTVDADGTAIGEGILTAVNRLSRSRGQTNVIILATDGTNNRGEDPLRAAEIAAARQIRIYLVGIGARGGAPVYTTDQFGMKQPYVRDGQALRWDEPQDKVLQQIAAKTGGVYFRAADEKALDAIYAQINQLIKDEKKRRDPHYKELFPWFLMAALAGLFLEVLLRTTWLRALT